MTNLEELRKEYALKVEAAEIENRLEEKTGIKCMCYPSTWKGKTVFHASFSASDKVLSLEDAARVINMLPQIVKTENCYRVFVDGWVDDTVLTEEELLRELENPTF